jgi:hypothetical protein
MLRSDEIPMNAKRTLTLVVIGAALIAWLAGAATSNRESAPPPTIARTPVDVQGADLAKEIARLHERLRPDAIPRQPGRNLFTYHAAVKHPAPIVEAPKPALSEPVTAIAPAQPPLKLAGIAEDPGPDGPLRTAIISGDGQLFLVKEGEAVTSRYRVARIAADVVELTDTLDGSTRRLALK